MSLISDYLKDLRDIYNTGSAVKETSDYTAFEKMASHYGKQLKPGVRCVINLKNKGAGMPDAGFFTSEQFQRGEDKPRKGQKPFRGCTEIKSTKGELSDFLQAIFLTVVKTYHFRDAPGGVFDEDDDERHFFDEEMRGGFGEQLVFLFAAELQ